MTALGILIGFIKLYQESSEFCVSNSGRRSVGTYEEETKVVFFKVWQMNG